jgi:ABC-type cobalamin/Fe3+-siderophores transport system ATPase subunit
MFRLLSLYIQYHHVLGNIKLDFCKNNDENAYPKDVYTTVVIGANGIGKSYLMRAIADIFSYLNMLSRGVEITKSPVGFNFRIRYRIGAADYEFSNFSDYSPVGGARRQYTHVYYKRKGEYVSVEQMVSPARIIASTRRGMVGDGDIDV